MSLLWLWKVWSVSSSNLIPTGLLHPGGLTKHGRGYPTEHHAWIRQLQVVAIDLESATRPTLWTTSTDDATLSCYWVRCHIVRVS